MEIFQNISLDFLQIRRLKNIRIEKIYVYMQKNKMFRFNCDNVCLFYVEASKEMGGDYGNMLGYGFPWNDNIFVWTR